MMTLHVVAWGMMVSGIKYRYVLRARRVEGEKKKGGTEEILLDRIVRYVDHGGDTGEG